MTRKRENASSRRPHTTVGHDASHVAGFVENAPAVIPPRISRTGSVLGLLVSSIVGQALLLATAPLIARTLGPTGRGYVALVAVYDDASTALFNLGLPLAIGFFAKEGIHSASSLLGSARRYGFLALPVSLITAVGAVIWPLRSLPPSTRMLAFVVLAQSPLVNTLGISARQLLLSRGDLAGTRVLLPLTSGIRLLLLLAALAAGHLTVPFVIVATAVSGYAANIYAWVRCGERFGAPAPLRPLLAFGMKVMPGQVADLANSRLDQLLVAPYLGPADLGIYAVAAALTTVPTIVGSSLAWDAFSRVSRADAKGRTNPASGILRVAWLACGGITAFVAIVLVFGFVPLFGEAYRSGLPAALILLPGAVTLAVNLVAQQISIAIGKPHFVTWTQGAGLAVTVIGLPFAIPAWGIVGAAVVSTVAYSTRLALMLALLRGAGVSHVTPRREDVAESARRLLGRLSRLRGGATAS